MKEHERFGWLLVATGLVLMTLGFVLCLLGGAWAHEFAGTDPPKPGYSGGPWYMVRTMENDGGLGVPGGSELKYFEGPYTNYGECVAALDEEKVRPTNKGTNLRCTDDPFGVSGSDT